jgi:hypothetical protein
MLDLLCTSEQIAGRSPIRITYGKHELYHAASTPYQADHFPSR